MIPKRQKVNKHYKRNMPVRKDHNNLEGTDIINVMSWTLKAEDFEVIGRVCVERNLKERCLKTPKGGKCLKRTRFSP